MNTDKRLIDANALKEWLGCDGDNKYSSMIMHEIADRIDEQPTIDAVPVVRCKDCVKFWEYTEEHKATVEKADGDCMIRCMVAPDDPQFCAVQKDDYCSMGKRKSAKMDGGAEG